MQFREFKLAIQRQFNDMKSKDLFRVQLDKDDLWDTYLASFPEGTNLMFRERTEHDCNCCKQFIRAVGNMVAIVDGKLVSIWDIKVDSFYQEVADKLSSFIKGHSIESIFLHYERNAGTDKNYEIKDGVTKEWEHFHIQLPSDLVVPGQNIGTLIGDARSTKDVMLRALVEITSESIDTVLELISQGSLYRGDEYKFAVESFLKLKSKFDKLTDATAQNLFCWEHLKSTPASVSKIRSTVIGSLLVDLSEGKDIENAVGAYEFKVAPTNYKRPTALITQAMIDKAKAEIEGLGLTNALDRRFAVLEDISVNNVLFADRSAKKRMDSVFGDLAPTAPQNTKTFDKVEEVSIESFIKDILPKADSIEVMLENKLNSNLVSLIAPCDLTAKSMFKWQNPFSWSYNGDLADSIKEKVKAAGGNVTGDLCCRLAWYNDDDLDAYMIEPTNHVISYHNKRRLSPLGGMLDVDANGGDGIRPNPVENIFYARKATMKEGIYKFGVHQFAKRKTTDVGFEAEIDFMGTIYHFVYDKPVKDAERIIIAEFKYTHAGGVEIIKSIPSTQAVKVVWGIPTQTFHKVSVMMLSPNYWDNKAVGNKHYFFFMEGCINEGKARGFFNEFLTSELDTHRKVFEVVGSKMKTEESPNQLSGLGFSSTQRNSVLCKVKGTFTRTIKINF